MEIVAGVVAIAVAAGTWSGRWWSWLMLGVGLLNLAPWGGANAILRQAQKSPEVLVTDPEQRRERGRRFARYAGPILIASFAATGYLLQGVGGAIFFCAVALAAVWIASKAPP